jgi:hypothetical protein
VRKSRVLNGTRIVLYVIVGLILAGGIINCGGSSSSGPVQVQAPKAMIEDFIAKYDTMIDSSLVDFYVADEQPTVAAAVKRTIDEKTASGELEKLKQASFDFSNLKIAVADEKEVYVHDEPAKVIKVTVSGSYNMKQEDNTETIPADKTIILQMVGNEWKVTERINPWKEYKYKTKG